MINFAPSLVVFDLDGTAIDSHPNRATSNNLTGAISRLRRAGIHVCAATGRSASSMLSEEAVAHLGLDSYAVVSGGGAILDVSLGVILEEVPIPIPVSYQLFQLLLPHNFDSYFVNDYPEDLFLEGGSPLEYDPRASWYFIGLARVPDALAQDLAHQIRLIGGISVVVTRGRFTGTRELHITSSNATKNHATRRIQALLGVNREQSVAIGDGHNDVDLFRAVAYRVAMGNAVRPLKDIADEVIGPVSEDSLARFLLTIPTQ